PNVRVDSSGSAVHSAFSHKQWDMVEFLRQHGGVVTADTAAIYRQTDLTREMLAQSSSEQKLVEELLRFGALGGDPEIVRMALERTDWGREDERWFRLLIEPLSFWHHIPWLCAGNREFDRSTYLTCFLLMLDRCDPNLTGGFGQNALHEVAAMREHVNDDEASLFARALLHAGADLARRDSILNST